MIFIAEMRRCENVNKNAIRNRKVNMGKKHNKT